MSGESQVTFVGPAMRPLVHAAARLAEADLGRFAVIGGVAVTARLGRAHRATTDLDTVVDDDDTPPVIEVLRELDGAVADAANPHRVYVDGIKVEVIGTGRLDERDLAGLTDSQALFVGGHRWALEAATLMTLATEDGVQATVPVARASALVAMKLHAIQERRAVGGLDKRAGDAWDIYRLLTDLDMTGIAAEIAGAMAPLSHLVVEAAATVLMERAGRTRGWLRLGDAEMAAVTPDELAFVGDRLIQQLRASAGGR